MLASKISIVLYLLALSTSALLGCLSQVIPDVDPTDGSTLILVVETFRHGARHRIYNSAFPQTDQNDFGELTAQGQRMHYVLGQTLRAKYVNSDIHFPAKYDHNFIWAKSTNVNRTIQSAESQLAGMFPLTFGSSVAGVGLNFLLPPFPNPNMNGLDNSALPQGQQPVPIHVREEKDEQQLLGYSSTACVNAGLWSKANVGDVDWNRIQGEFQPIINQLIAIPDLKIPPGSNMEVISQLVDTLIAIKWLNDPVQTAAIAALIDGYTLTLNEMALPKNRNVLWVKMNLLYTIQLSLALFKTPQQKKTSVTPYFNELLAYFNNAIANPNYFKWIMLSAHDTTIAMVSQGMNLTSWECMEQFNLGTLPVGSNCLYTYPGFASNIIYELYEDKNKLPFIKMMYNGTAQSLCSTTNTWCYLNTFTDIINYQNVADYNTECGNPVYATGDAEESSLPTWSLITLIVGGVFLLGAVVYIVILRKKISANASGSNYTDMA